MFPQKEARIPGLLAAALTVAILAPSSSGAQAIPAGAPPEEGEQLEEVTLTIAPAEAPVPRLRFALRHAPPRQRPENAALGYQRALVLLASGDEPDDRAIADWLEMPLSELRANEAVEEAVRQHRMALEELTLASRGEWCHWQHRVREQGIQALLPGLGSYRRLARLLMLRARLRIARGQLADAIDDLRTGLALGRHLAEGQTLIQGLVAVSVTVLVLEQVEVLIQQRDAPNLYWSLTDLPDPFIDPREVSRWEGHVFAVSFPELDELDPYTYSAEQYRKVLRELTSLTNRQPGAGDQLMAAAVALRAYPRAKERLRELGHSEEQIERMTVPGALMLVTTHTLRRDLDEMLSLLSLPYWEAAPLHTRLERRLMDLRDDDLLSFLSRIALPAVSRAHLSLIGADRKIAVLRTIEAIRLHAAQHGDLPATLDEVTAVPIPVDPALGEPFRYERTREGATLTAPVPANGRARDGRICHLHLRGTN